jgi:hypothetical protein
LARELPEVGNNPKPLQMHHVTFYPIGNADTTLIQLKDLTVNILFDFADERCASDAEDKRCDLPKELNKAVSADTFDVVCFTHLDRDHINGSSLYFHLDHSGSYQQGERKKIKELWVPASVITESRNDCGPDARAIQAEARYRLRQGYGIRVFSKPKKLKDWCAKQNISFEGIGHLIVDAGKLVPSIILATHGAEFFVHSPFYDESAEIDRNNSAVVVHCTFDNTRSSKLLLGSDIGYEVWEDIIKVTKYKGNVPRLEWDLFHLSHHCSYKSLAADKGTTKTDPSEALRWLFVAPQARPGATIVSPSWSIPTVFGPASGEQPPHKQAYNFYNQDADGVVKVTMDYPSKQKPKPMKFEIGYQGAKLVPITIPGSGSSGPSSRPPRAGSISK